MSGGKGKRGLSYGEGHSSVPSALLPCVPALTVLAFPQPRAGREQPAATAEGSSSNMYNPEMAQVLSQGLLPLYMFSPSKHVPNAVFYGVIIILGFKDNLGNEAK